MISAPRSSRIGLSAFVLAIIGIMAAGTTLGAQEPQASSAGVESTSSITGPETDPGDAGAAAALPVSLDRIREALAKPSQIGSLHSLDLKPDFSVQVQENAAIQAVLSTLDFKTGPRPAGGLYAYEQQQQIWNKVDRPLAQPYAGFSGGELITLAVEGLLQKYLGSALVSGISKSAHESAERAAKEEVTHAISEYCDSRPDAGRSLQVCSVDSLSR